MRRLHFSFTFKPSTAHRCHRSLENQPRRVEMNRPLNFYNPNEHFRSKKLPSRALRGVSWNENANLRKFAGRIISTLAGRIVVTADTSLSIGLGLSHAASAPRCALRDEGFWLRS